MNNNKKVIKKRVFNICQYEINPITGESLNFNESNIIAALSKKTFKKWAYGLHDKDVFSKQDEINDRERLKNEYIILREVDPKKIENVTESTYIEENLVKKEGILKPRHWHIVVSCDCAMEISDVARWFGVPSNMVEIPNGRGKAALLDCIAYIPHTSEACQAQGKYMYDTSIVKANFDWQKEYADMIAKRAKYKKDINDKEYVFREVCYEGMTLKNVRLNYPEIWVKHITELKKLRADYLANLPKPNNRINYYVCGAGRSGKGLLSRAIARTMFPNMDDDDIFFEVGATNVTFEGYDGQPVIIWNDCRSADLFKKLGDRENIFNVFDSHPSKQKQNVKFGSINLVNVVNIVNSVQSYVDFLDGLAGEYTDKSGVMHLAEDKRQSYERFPIIIPIHAEDFELLFNRGYFYHWDDFTQYRVEAKIKANLPKIARACNNNKELEDRLNNIVLEPIKDRLIDTITTFPEEKTDEEITNEILNNLGYGQLLEVEDDVENERDFIVKCIFEEYKKFDGAYTKYIKENGYNILYEINKNYKGKFTTFDLFCNYDKYFKDKSNNNWQYSFYFYNFKIWLGDYEKKFGVIKYNVAELLKDVKAKIANCD